MCFINLICITSTSGVGGLGRRTRTVARRRTGRGVLRRPRRSPVAVTPHDKQARLGLVVKSPKMRRLGQEGGPGSPQKDPVLISDYPDNRK
jgi:hypothetical protein